jgi:hypothetical protein
MVSRNVMGRTACQGQCVQTPDNVSVSSMLALLPNPAPHERDQRWEGLWHGSCSLESRQNYLQALPPAAARLRGAKGTWKGEGR